MGGRFCLVGLLGFTLLAGCGKGVGDYQVPSEFQTYVSQFASDAAQHNRTVDIHSLVVEFGDTQGAAGQCLMSFLSTPKIVISQDMWNSFDDGQRTILLYHELGHCILNRVHTTATVEVEALGTIPDSIMNPVMLDEIYFSQDHDHYLSELFGD